MRNSQKEIILAKDFRDKQKEKKYLTNNDPLIMVSKRLQLRAFQKWYKKV